MAKILWLASWNCENQAPDDEELHRFVWDEANNALFQDVPDLIAIGLQEAWTDSPHLRGFVQSGKWIGERLAQTTKLGGKYKLVANETASGFTKGKMNMQYLGVLVHLTAKPHCQDLQVLTKTKGAEGKGGIAATMTFHGRKIAIITAHLDSKDPEKQLRNVKDLLRVITGLGSDATPLQLATRARQNYHAVFLMGDLNFRLIPQGTLQTAFQNTPQTPGAMPVPYKGISKMEMAQRICTPAGRAQLWTLDGLNQSILVDPNQYGFSFPGFTNLSYPTYKRAYKPRGNANPTKLFVENPTPQNCVRAYFDDTGGEAEYERRDAFECGWLDRVGIITRNGTTVTVNSFTSLDTCYLSDHTPILMKVSIS